jgi:hypothetical protein
VSMTKVHHFDHIETAKLRLQKVEAYNRHRSKNAKLSRLSHTIADDF